MSVKWFKQIISLVYEILFIEAKIGLKLFLECLMGKAEGKAMKSLILPRLPSSFTPSRLIRKQAQKSLPKQSQFKLIFKRNYGARNSIMKFSALSHPKTRIPEWEKASDAACRRRRPNKHIY